MKAFILGLLVTTSAFAQYFPGPYNYFPGQAQVSVFPQQITAQVFNPFYRPVICSGTVFGRTMNGVVLNAFFAEQFMPVGASRYAFVTASYYAPFVQGWATVNCRYAF